MSARYLQAHALALGQHDHDGVGVIHSHDITAAMNSAG